MVHLSSASANRTVTKGSPCSRLRSSATRYLREVRGRLLTKSTLLLVVYMFAINTCTVVAYEIVGDLSFNLQESSCWEHQPMEKQSTHNILNFGESFVYLLIPVAGWVADTRIGRGSALVISLWTGWIGTLLQSLSSSLQYRICGSETVLFAVAKYGLSSISLLLLLVSVSFCYANIFAHGLSQLLVTGESSVKVRAYIHWIVWILFISGNPIFVTMYLHPSNPYSRTITVSMFSCIVFSVCLCLHSNLSHWFEEIYMEDHYKILWGVLKYAWRHKHPENRSSMTYWEDKLPNRFDYAKQAFGGPYTNENVETVKTFLRILVILLALIPFLVASDPLINEIPDFVAQFKGGADRLSGVAGYIIWFIGDDLILVVIPTLELVILPLFPKLEYFLINPLKGLGLSMILLIISIGSLFIFDFVGRITVNEKIPCFNSWTTQDSELGLSFWVLLIPSIFAGLADMLSCVCVFEFLCSQAPSGMSGMLIGAFWFLRSICIDLNTVLLQVFQSFHVVEFPLGRLSCTSFLMFIFGSVAIFGLLVYILAAKWYTGRVRNDDLNLRKVVEEHYEQQMVNSERYLTQHKQNLLFNHYGSLSNN